MKTSWIKKENNKHLILFFAGWGMDELPVSHLQVNDYDFLLVYDYRDLGFEEDISKYNQITLIAWSFGVFIASHIAKDIKNITKAIAINGTPIPIDKGHGIPPRIFQLTLNTLNTKSLQNFTQNMFTEKEEYLKFKRPNRTPEDQKEELAAIEKHYEKLGVSDFKFDCALISNMDKIIPTKNQKNFWQKNFWSEKDIKVVELESGHYPFFKYNNWNELINDTNI